MQHTTDGTKPMVLPTPGVARACYLNANGTPDEPGWHRYGRGTFALEFAPGSTVVNVRALKGQYPAWRDHSMACNTHNLWREAGKGIGVRGWLLPQRGSVSEPRVAPEGATLGMRSHARTPIAGFF